MRSRETRITDKRSLVGPLGLFLAAEAAVRDAQVVPGAREVRLYLRGQAEVAARVLPGDGLPLGGCQVNHLVAAVVVQVRERLQVVDAPEHRVRPDLAGEVDPGSSPWPCSPLRRCAPQRRPRPRPGGAPASWWRRCSRPRARDRAPARCRPSSGPDSSRRPYRWSRRRSRCSPTRSGVRTRTDCSVTEPGARALSSVS